MKSHRHIVKSINTKKKTLYVPLVQCERMGWGTRVVFYASLDGGGLRPSGPSSGSAGDVRTYRGRRVCEHYKPNIYRFIIVYIVYYDRTRNCKLVGEWRTSIRELSEMWGGDRRDADSDRDCHESISGYEIKLVHTNFLLVIKKKQDVCT